MRVSVVETKDGKELSVTIDLDGTNHEVMNIAEMAQSAEIMGEVGVDVLLKHILNDKSKASAEGWDDPLQI